MCIFIAYIQLAQCSLRSVTVTQLSVIKPFIIFNLQLMSRWNSQLHCDKYVNKVLPHDILLVVIHQRWFVCVCLSVCL